ncbi:Auxin response factor 3 [Camellia lanceoleosa]|uniref:Auxin response factor 3 n=1 Tax=Camellia lanceoleosa TaxID=1840588 RepID=A0ACC0GHU2_9ERIC|nr:Auxin response factor 3 [Camellia lanceoleosa]
MHSTFSFLLENFPTKMCSLIDLNTVDDDDDDDSPPPPPPPFDSPSSSPAVCLELWHACAGPLISLPKKGTVVVYFPQGHLEHASDFPATIYHLPPHVFCRVLHVNLHAEAATDEVYAQVSLIPDAQQIEQKWRQGKIEAESEEEDIEGAVKSITPHMFCKTLTASDTSTHGGFSVPRRAAEDCFPPLDYKQQRPSQELVAKDLHGVEWKFRHIYRGQPRRHLLTTSWSAFINKKKLVSGDAVLFLRGGDGELRLGIRRAAQVKTDYTFPALSSQKLNVGTISAVVNAISMRNVFNVRYNPRASLSEFIIPFHKFSKSLSHSSSVGMRFKMRFETEDATERRYTGLVTGVNDVDPVRWPGSKWRCLLVRWDDLESPDITGVGLSSTKPDFPVPRDGTGMSDFGESFRFQKVLQGQEILGFNSPCDVHNYCSSEMRRCNPGSVCSTISAIGNGVRNPFGDSSVSYDNIGFGESFQFDKVLQGQETYLNSGYRRGPAANKVQENQGQGITDGVPSSSSGSGWSALMRGHNACWRSSTPSLQSSSPSSVLMFQQTCTPALNFHSTCRVNQEHEINNQKAFDISDTHCGKEVIQGVNSFAISTGQNQQGISHSTLATHSSYGGSQDLGTMCKSSCRLFGFPLTEGRNTTNKDCNPTQDSSAYNPDTSFLLHGDQHLHPKPPLVTKLIGSSCTKVSDLYAVRDMLLDVAL